MSCLLWSHRRRRGQRPRRQKGGGLVIRAGAGEEQILHERSSCQRQHCELQGSSGNHQPQHVVHHVSLLPLISRVVGGERPSSRPSLIVPYCSIRRVACIGYIVGFSSDERPSADVS